MAGTGSGFFDEYEGPVDTNDVESVLNGDKSPQQEQPPQQEPKTVKKGFKEPKDDHAPPVSGFTEEETGVLKGDMQVKEEATVNQGRDWMNTSPHNPAWTQIKAARGRATRSHKHVLMGIAGPPKSGKSGMVLDSLTEEEKAAGAEVWHIDFDAGGEATKSAHHAGSPNLVVHNPWVMNPTPSRVPYDFPATFQRTIDFLKAANEMADAQMAYFEQNGKMPNPYLKTVCFDGADHWLNICETTMKVDDLQLGVDGIATAGKATTTQIGRFNWNIRKNRYNSALTALQELCRRGIHCYIITHLKSSYDSAGNEIIGAETPHWLRDTEGWLQQMCIVEAVEERDERGQLTGEVNSYAILTENRTSLKSSGRIHLFRRDDDGGEWFGWPGLRDGTFESPEDVKDDSEVPSE